MTAAAERLKRARRILIKIGSALLYDGTGLRQGWIDALAADIAKLKKGGKDIAIVTSGAVALGRHAMFETEATLDLAGKQAAASHGQIALMQAYREAFQPHDINIAQILLTIDDTEDRRRHLNARATIETLLSAGLVPVINENDTVATEEIRFGDNDRLAARVAQMISADMLILLSDIDGLYKTDPRKNPDAEHIPVVSRMSAEIESMAGPPPKGNSSGGMVTKLQAARIAMAAGTDMLIASGVDKSPLTRLAGGERATIFTAMTAPQTARKRWIAAHVSATGAVRLDGGAVAALEGGRSLLPVGIAEVQGPFARGDVIRILDTSGIEIGRGMVNYDAEDLTKIIGKKSDEFEDALGYKGADTALHRNDLILHSEKDDKGEKT